MLKPIEMPRLPAAGLRLLPSSAERARVAGAALRGFRNLADEWSLTERERIACLGEPPRSTYHNWMSRVGDRKAVSLPYDTLLRISALLGVYKGLQILFRDQAAGIAWLRGAHGGPVFAGAAPMSFLTHGALDGMMTVRRYLDAMRGGDMGAGAAEGRYTPVTEDDVVFL